MNDEILGLLQKTEGDIEEKMEHHQAQLEQKEYFLLVAGDYNKAILVQKAV